MSLSYAVEGEKGVVTVSMPMTAATADEFRENFLAWFKGHTHVKWLVLDMDQVELMDSAGLGALMAVFKRITENGGDLKLARMQRKPRMVFELTRAHRMFDIRDSVEEALSAF